MDTAKIIKKIKAGARNGKISCKKALQIAAEENVTPKTIGKILNDNSIKIVTCQLGCFQ
jgi:hypothetical protein